MKTFSQFLIESKAGTLYFPCTIPIEDVFNKKRQGGASRLLSFMAMDNGRLNYAKDEGRWKYIYRLNPNTKVFTESEFKKLIPVLQKMNYYDKWRDSDFKYKEFTNEFFLTNEIIEYLINKGYGGFVDSQGYTKIFIDYLVNTKNSYYLIYDINKVLSNQPNVEDLIIPEFVKDELNRYVDDAGVKMNKSVRDWLKSNIKLPYNQILLFRSVGSELGYANWDIPEMELSKVEKKLYAHFGVKKLEDMRVKQIIDLKRGKESSWSKSARTALIFSTGVASKTLNILVKSVIKAEDVLVDLTALPNNIRNQLKFIGQLEVIVDTNKTSCQIESIWLDRQFKEKIADWNYEFVNSTGIVKK